jgi:hypothetical protein
MDLCITHPHPHHPRLFAFRPFVVFLPVEPATGTFHFTMPSLVLLLIVVAQTNNYSTRMIVVPPLFLVVALLLCFFGGGGVQKVILILLVEFEMSNGNIYISKHL